MYVNDGDASDMSMRNFREYRPPSKWKQMGGGSAILMVVFALSIGFFMGYDQASSKVKSQEQLNPIVIDAKSGVARYSSMTTPLELLGLVRKTRSTLMQKLIDEYGEFANVLMEKSNLEKVFHLNSDSKMRYRRRIIQKILTKQLKPKDTVPFTWVTAGDVRAAGFGNDPAHSYTSMLDDTARDAFRAVGLNFVANNHGVYNFPSGPAAALCIDTVYGSDIDILSWDFSLTDGDFEYRAALFGMRATLHPTRPLLMMIDRREDLRWQKFFWGEGKVGVGLLDTAWIEKLAIRDLPDSVQITHPEQLPPALQYLRCHESIEGHLHCDSGRAHHVCNEEKGAICRDNKFLDKDSCDMVKYQSDWNAGW
jgi:hypothetical protein